MDQLEALFATSNPLITETAMKVKSYINKTWPKFKVVLEIPLRELFPNPNGRGGLQTMWKFGSADIIVYKGKEIVAIFEPGGSHHFTDEKQIKRDKCKWKLCELNGVRCFKFANSLIDGLSKKKLRAMFGKFLFGPKTSKET